MKPDRAEPSGRARHDWRMQLRYELVRVSSKREPNAMTQSACHGPFGGGGRGHRRDRSKERERREGVRTLDCRCKSHIKEAPRQSLGGGREGKGDGGEGRASASAPKKGRVTATEGGGLETHTFTLLGAVYYPNGGSTVTSALSALPGTAGQARLSGVLGSVRL